MLISPKYIPFFCRAVDEITLLGVSIRKSYIDIDEVVEDRQSAHRTKSSGKKGIPPTVGSSGKRQSKGKKGRIAPISSESQHGDGDVLSQEIEMVNLPHRREISSSVIGGDSSSIQESPLHESKETSYAEDQDQLDQSKDQSHSSNRALIRKGAVDLPNDVIEENSASAEPSEILEEDEATQRLIDHRHSSGDDFIRTGKVVVADTLRFLFLGIPG